MENHRANMRRQRRAEKKAASQKAVQQQQEQKQQRPAGFQCPNCQFFIEVTIEGLLFQKSQKCPSCMTEFTMDRGESKEALGLIQKVHAAMQNLDSAKQFKGK